MVMIKIKKIVTIIFILFILNTLNGCIEEVDKEESNLNFACVTDQHYGFSNKRIPLFDNVTINDWMYNPSLPELDFVFSSLGDWISDNRGKKPPWDNPYYCIQKITENNCDFQKIPYFFIFGNHDLTNFEYMDDGNHLKKMDSLRSISGLNENNYAFLYNNVLFICLGQTTVLSEISNFQKSWLQYLCEKYQEKTTVILTHQAIINTTGKDDGRSTTWNGNDYRTYNNMSFWKNFFEKNPQIKLYLHGHLEKAFNSTYFNFQNETWDDNCLFVNVVSNGREYTHKKKLQESWSLIVEISDSYISIKNWDSKNNKFISIKKTGIPFNRTGMRNNVTNSGMEWFSIPQHCIDGEKWRWKNYIIAEKYNIELVGSNFTELLDNNDLSGCHESDETKGKNTKLFWYSISGDHNANNKKTGEKDGYISINDGNFIEIADKPTIPQKFIDGKAPFNTALAIPNKTYVFSCKLKAIKNSGYADLLISIPSYKNISNYVLENHKILTNILVEDYYKNFSVTFSLPDNKNMWYINPKIRFHKVNDFLNYYFFRLFDFKYNFTFDYNTTFIIDSWSLKMLGDSDFTENFSISINNQSYIKKGILENNSNFTFELNNTIMNNNLDFNCSIDGNKIGFIRLIYSNPLLVSDDVSFGIKNKNQSSIYIKDVSPYNTWTTIMSYNNLRLRICDEKDWGTEIVRGKKLFINPKNNNTINGLYEFIWN